MRFGTAIERLVDNYRTAKGKAWIRDEVAWALYQTWKEADRKTEPQTRTDEDGRVWEYRNGNWWQLGKTEPQTEDAYAYDEDDWYDKTEREGE